MRLYISILLLFILTLSSSLANATLEVVVIDGDGIHAEVHSPLERFEEPDGLVVYTEPRKVNDSLIRFFVNDTFGVDMNQNVTFGGSPEGINDGNDSVLWLATPITGTWASDSTAQANSGTRSVDATDTVNGNEIGFLDDGSTDMSGFTAVTGFVYLTGFSAVGTKHIESRFRASGITVGNSVDVDDFIDTGLLNAWQKFTIDKSQYGINGQTVDEFVIQTVDIGGGQPPDYYFDDVQIEETGSPQEYILPISEDETIKLTRISIVMADAFAGTLADGTMPRIPYDSFLGVSALTIGINVQQVRAGGTVFSQNIKQFIDIMQLPGSSVAGTGSDGTNTWVKIDVVFDEPIFLEGKTLDEIKITINDDLSGLLLFRISTRVVKEITE